VVRPKPIPDNNPERVEGVKIQKGIKYWNVPFVDRKKNGN
jgi:hypothetical protein